MTRQQRRRNKRKKDTTYNLTAAQISSMAAEAENKAYNRMKNGLNQQIKDEGRDLTLQAFQQTFYIPLLVLRNEGWGKIRLKRFAEAMIEQVEMFEEKYFNSKDVEEMIKDETGIDLKFELDFKNQRSTIKLVS